MDFQYLLEFIKSEDIRLRNKFGSSDQEKRILARTVKLGEEVGELCDEVLSFNSMQRTEKLSRKNADNLPDEIADVIITTMLLAQIMEVDIAQALESKIEKIKKRHEDR